jgi:hypothetical protein
MSMIQSTTDDLPPLMDVLPSEAELQRRECRAQRELDLVRRLRRIVARRDLYREGGELAEEVRRAAD